MGFIYLFFSFSVDEEDCSSPVIPVDGGRALSKSCSKRVHANKQHVFIHTNIYDKMCPYQTITLAPAKEQKKQFCYQVFLQIKFCQLNEETEITRR